MNEPFRRFSRRVANATGSASAFVLAALVVIVWLITGPIYGYSNTWQLVINTGTTIVTFLMVFLIQNTQNRDSLALHLKLDELIRALRSARNGLVDLEDLSDGELRKLQREFERLRRGTPADDGQSFGELAVAAEQVRQRRGRRPERGTRDRGGEERRPRKNADDDSARGAPAEARPRRGRDDAEPRAQRPPRPRREPTVDRPVAQAETESLADGADTESAVGGEGAEGAPATSAERAERARRRRRRRRGGSGGQRRDAGAPAEGADGGGESSGPPAPPPSATGGEP